MAYSTVNTNTPIQELVTQSTSRYSLIRPLNNIVEYNSDDIYSNPWLPELSTSDDDRFEQVTDPNFRLDSLAYHYYNDPKLWWVLAAVNNIKNPLSITYGSVLRIPSLTNLIKNGVIS